MFCDILRLPLWVTEYREFFFSIVFWSLQLLRAEQKQTKKQEELEIRMLGHTGFI